MSLEENVNNNKNISSKNTNNENEPKKDKEALMEQKFKIDVINGFGANTKEDLKESVIFLTKNNYMLYNVGAHLLIRNIHMSLKNEDVNLNDNQVFFINLSNGTRKITSMNVSDEKCKFVVCEEFYKDRKEYWFMTVYNLDKLMLKIYSPIEPIRKIITDKYSNFTSTCICNKDDFLCTLAIDNSSSEKVGLIYDLQPINRFKLNETNPIAIIGLVDDNNTILVKKISYDRQLICTSGDYNLNIYQFNENIIREFPVEIAKTKIFVDHSFYFQEKKDDDKLIFPILITITDANELYIIQGVRASRASLFYDEDDILSDFKNLEKFVVKQCFTNIFDDLDCFASKMSLLNNNDFFDGVLLGNNKGKIVIYEKNRSRSIVEYKKLASINNINGIISKVTCITSNLDQTILSIAYDNNDITYCNFKALIYSIRDNQMQLNFRGVCDGFHSGKVTVFDTPIQRPIILSVGENESKVKLWNYITGYSENLDLSLVDYLSDIKEKYKILSLAIHPFGYYVVCSTKEMLYFFALCHKELRLYGNETINYEESKQFSNKLLDKLNDCYILKFSHGGHLLAAVNEDKNLFIINTFNREVRLVLNINHKKRITDIKFSENDLFLYSIGLDGSVYEINLFLGAVERIYNNDGVGFSSFDVFFTYEDNNMINHNLIIAGYEEDRKKYSISLLSYRPKKTEENSPVVNSDVTLIKDQVTAILVIIPKKIERNCIVCGTNDGKIILFPYPIKSAKYKWDELKSHKSRITQLMFNTELNMLFSCGEDGCVFIYSTYEMMGDNILYDKRYVSIMQMNTTIDINLGEDYLFPIQYLEDLERTKIEIKAIESNFKDEEERLMTAHEKLIKKIKEELDLKKEIEKNKVESHLKEVENEYNQTKKLYENEILKNMYDKNDAFKNNTMNNFDKLHEIENELKTAKLNLKNFKEKKNKEINDKINDYTEKLKLLTDKLNDKYNLFEKKNNEINNKYVEEYKNKNAFIENLENENKLRNNLNEKELEKYTNEYKFNYGNINYEMIKFNDLIEKLELNVEIKTRDIKRYSEELSNLEKLLHKAKLKHIEKLNKKDVASEKFKLLQKDVQDRESNEIFTNKLRTELYRQKFEIKTKYQESTIKNNEKIKTHHNLQKGITHITEQVFKSDTDRKNILEECEDIKKSNEILKHKIFLQNERFNVVLQKIFNCFKANDKNEIYKCACEIYKEYSTDEFIQRINKQLLDKNILLEIESQIGTIQKEIDINKAIQRAIQKNKEIFKEEKIRENSIVIDSCISNKKSTEDLIKNIGTLKRMGRISTRESSNAGANNSNISCSSNFKNSSSTMRKNSSMPNLLPPIPIDKNNQNTKNKSYIPPTTQNCQEDEDIYHTHGSKKDSFYDKAKSIIANEILNSN